MKIAIIKRNASDSPNMAGNDAAILESVAEELKSRDAEVTVIDGHAPIDADIICHMTRTGSTLDKIAEAEKNGAIAINSAAAVRRCSRIALMQELQKSGIPQPEFTVFENDEAIDALPYPAWIKRGDGWSCHKNDVCFTRNINEAKEAVAEMRSRGISRHVHCKHIEGDIVKFYGIGERFFHYCYPDPDKSKFGLEKINGAPHHYAFSMQEMRETAFSAAKAVGVEIYGGDCIVDKNGSIYIIDLNDFPSFTAVRSKAAYEIAEHITMRYIEENERRR